MTRLPQIRWLADGKRLHLQEGPIDLIIEAYGTDDDVRSAYEAAIRALNGGAKDGGFAHNTGEGGLTPYHLENGGDIIWQIGTGYFSCRDGEGRFSAERFRENALHPHVKMIEIKLSQGAKPSHGGILPAAKVTEEIARIRGVPLGRDVLSPPAHSEFSTPMELLRFVVRMADRGRVLRQLVRASGGADQP